MPATHEPRRVHTVVVGASAGGVEALRSLVASLPEGFNAAVLVVLHLAPTATSALPQILARAGGLPAKQAEDGEAIEPGRIYVAPPNVHLVVMNGHAGLDGGPKVNNHRPAVDALFRSAAEAHGAGVAGVVLSGTLDDGTVGLLAIKRAGGTTLVQDPEEALYEGMPSSAIEYVRPDHVGTVAELGKMLATMAVTPPPDPPLEGREMRRQHVEEVQRGSSEQPQPGEQSGLTCPDCQGGIWLSTESGTSHFRCRVGHEYTEESFVAAQGDRVETALWTALRALEERSALHRRIAKRSEDRGQSDRAVRYQATADDAVDQAVVLRELLATFVRSADEDAA